MSKLDELISKLCPDGVEFKTIKEVYTRLKGTPITAAKMKEIENNNGDIRIFAGGKTVIDAYEKDIPKANITRVPAVLIQSRGVIDAVYYDRPFTFKNEMWAYTHENITSVKFLYYVLKNNLTFFRKTAAGMGALPQISLKITEDFKIPVPPLEVQSEVVRILDKFTELTAELTAELIARKKQYEYYRNRVLEHPKNECFMVAISELGKWSGGKTPSTANKEYWENGTIPWISSKDMKNSTLEDTEDHLTEKALEDGGMKLFPEGIVAIVTRSGILKHTFPIAYVPFRTTVNQDIKALVVKDGISSRYVFHAMQAYAEDIRKSTKKQGGTVDSLDFQRLLAYKIPVPTLEVQNRLADVLDNFESICSDLNIGLPAEIELRKKQYEFYRDALLTFAETGNIIAQTDRQTDRQNLIKLLQYVFGYVSLSLNDICTRSSSGATPKKGNSNYYAGGTIPWLRTQDVRFNEVYEATAYITENAVKETSAKWIPENCVIIAISGASAGRCAINKIPLTTNQHCLNIEIDPAVAMYKYVFYCVCSQYEELLSRKEGARGDLNASRILSLKIPVPSFERQKCIVTILDRFDALCNGISSGLPAEIEARQKQYEYYRDKLLSF